MKVSVFLFFLVLTVSCKSYFNNSSDTYKKTDTLVNLWHHKDSFLDSIYGISLEKWYNEKPKKINREIIVATLDGQIDLNHEDLQGQFWVNKNEVTNNGIDDDNNGYIDDVNGWNFVGKPNGGYYIYGNFESVRILKSSDKKYSTDSLFAKEKARAELSTNSKIEHYKRGEKTMKLFDAFYEVINDSLMRYFPNGKYTYNQLDSLYNIKKINDKSFAARRNNLDSDIGALVFYKMSMINFRLDSRKIINDRVAEMDSILYRNLGLDFNERKYIGDNPEILEKGYGNSKLNEAKNLRKHNTEVSSIIGANRSNNIGTKGFHKNIKIMPLNISTSGDEHDKDIAMAIRYAVDNGAKVINMSFGKEFSLHLEWVQEAFKYAEEHNVLLVHSSGNNNFNVDDNPFYPNDVEFLKNNKEEVVQNFINVGSMSKRVDSTMVSSFSNYGKNNVDLFAPGEDIYVAIPDNQYKYDSGTSLAAPMVSGTAALIWLYYPNLTVQEVKNIILESGVTIDKMVVKPGTKNEMVHFSELCKTGKVLNTYNAMKMAKELSKKKK
uniref:S8 family peptidase n=2 Tax=Flavobacterium sp. TaxID=239 RepID=UPI004048A13F